MKSQAKPNRAIQKRSPPRAATAPADDPAPHRVPVIDKMMAVLELLRQSAAGLTINDVVKQTRIPRSTVYRILNTLGSHGVVSRKGGATYVLGIKLVSLAAGVDPRVGRDDLVRLGHGPLEDLAAATGETCKISVLSDGRAEVIDVAQSPSEMAPTSRVGSTFALHAGAASKLLLAHERDAVVEEICAGSLKAYTPNTIVDRSELQRELETIRKEGLSFDRGEWNLGVHAVAAPILGLDGTLVGAISATHFASPDEAEIRSRVIGPLLRAAQSLSAQLGHVAASAEELVPPS